MQQIISLRLVRYTYPPIRVISNNIKVQRCLVKFYTQFTSFTDNPTQKPLTYLHSRLTSPSGSELSKSSLVYNIRVRSSNFPIERSLGSSG